MEIAHIISSHLQFDLDWNVFDDKAKTEMYLRFDWSSNCGEFFRRELVKFILTSLKRNISPAKL